MGIIEDIANKHKNRMQHEVGKVVREKVAELKKQGLNEQQIADRLGVSPKLVRMVNNHLKDKS
jgi:DNA-binding CsgD family transcriptional regulator